MTDYDHRRKVHTDAVKAADDHLDSKRTKENKERLAYHKAEADRHLNALHKHGKLSDTVGRHHDRAHKKHVAHYAALKHNPHAAHEKDVDKHPNNRKYHTHAEYKKDLDSYEKEHRKVYSDHMKKHGYKNLVGFGHEDND